MKKVFLVSLAVLLAVTFILAVYFYAENRELQSRGKVRVFSLEKWFHSFSEVEFPNLSFVDVWTNDSFTFEYSAETLYTTQQVGNTFHWYQFRNNIRFSGACTYCITVSDNGIPPRVQDYYDKCVFNHTNGNVFEPILFDENDQFIDYDNPSDILWRCTTYAEEIVVDNDSFLDKLGLSFTLFFDYVDDVLTLVSKIVPWDAYEIIDIPNQSLWGGE